MAQELTISLHGDTFQLTDATEHSVFIPADVNGLRVLKAMLKAKNDNPLGKLGTNAKPTQAMIEAFLRNQQLEKQNAINQDLKELAEMF